MRALASGGPRAFADRGDRDARRCHPCLLAGADHEVDAPGVHLERHRAESADAVDDDERLARRAADDLGQLAQRVGDAGRGLVVGDEDRAVRLGAGQTVAQRRRVGGGAPLDLEAVDGCAEGGRDAARTGRRRSRW